MPYSWQYAAREAEIIAQAGRKHAITISTNMAGRGTDIILGGNPKVSSCICLSLSTGILLENVHKVKTDNNIVSILVVHA